MESIYNRVKTATRWRFERVEEGQGKRTAHLTPPFYARPWKDGKQRWHRLHAETFAAAKKEAEKLDAALTADAMGLPVAEAENIGNRTPLAVAVRRFMEDNASKAPKTYAQYQHALKQFCESTRVKYLDEVTVDVLKRFKADLEAKGYAGKTCDTRINVVYFMLKDNGITARIPTKYMPTIEEEPAVAYSEDELTKLFAAITLASEWRNAARHSVVARSQVARDNAEVSRSHGVGETASDYRPRLRRLILPGSITT